jgi:hypothetical protein
MSKIQAATWHIFNHEDGGSAPSETGLNLY